MSQTSTRNGGGGYHPAGDEQECLYERFPWLYAFCRDHLFRNDTEKIVAALWPAGTPSEGSSLLELGCGPGFYARRLAERFEYLRVTGIDCSTRWLRRARAAARQLANCTFEEGDVLALDRPASSVDAVVVSRLFIVLSEGKRVIEEMHRVLRPGGRCFVAEPRSAMRAAVPLYALRLRARLSELPGSPGSYPEPGNISVMPTGEFGALIDSQLWATTRRWQDTWYQYAVCEKRRR
ncbi:MAG: class I SAM-dependent methyltransferase [Rubrobacter sp.]